MGDQKRDEGRGGGLFALGLVLLAEPDRGSGGVDVSTPEAEGALAAGAGLEMEANEQQVEVVSVLVVRMASASR